MGDLIATCGSQLSRNHRLGEELAKGRTWAEIEATLPGTAEGAYTVQAALALAERLGVEMPIAREVERALFEGKSVQRCLVDLLARESKDELADYARWMARFETVRISLRERVARRGEWPDQLDVGRVVDVPERFVEPADPLVRAVVVGLDPSDAGRPWRAAQARP